MLQPHGRERVSALRSYAPNLADAQAVDSVFFLSRYCRRSLTQIAEPLVCVAPFIRARLRDIVCLHISTPTPQTLGPIAATCADFYDRAAT